MSTESDALQRKLAQGLSKIALAIRHGQQAAAGPRRLSPTQAQILAVVAANVANGATLRWIADSLGVTAATASDAVRTLEGKGLVAKDRDARDRRSLRVVLTAAGREEIRRVGLVPEALLEAVDELESGEQATLLRLVVKLIRSLQQRGEIPVARMCVTCQHFRPNVHADPETPHHCAFVDAAFGERQHMIDCPDHAPLPVGEQEVVWHRYLGRASAHSTPHSNEEKPS
jgi:DNA-binding MarR family transcriptional regulator